jgi:hypothetical protein
MDRDFMILAAFYGLYAVWVLVPLLPAVIIYLLFPNAPTGTEWNISGVALKAGGASGFYFAVLGLAYFNFVQPTTEYIKGLHQPYWVVEVPITFVDAVTPISVADQLTVEPFAYEFNRIDDKQYMVKLKFAERKTPDNIRLIVRDGQGYIHLKDLKTKENTYPLEKRIDLTKVDPIQIRPLLTGGQNKIAATGFPRQLQNGLETGDTQIR